jgi:hypothetical protein
MSARCPAWCVDHDRPDPLNLPTLHFGAPIQEAGEGPYLFQQGDDAPMVGLFGERLSIEEATRISAGLADCVTAATARAT